MTKAFKTRFQGYIYPIHPLIGYEVNAVVVSVSNKQAYFELAKKLSPALKIPVYILYNILRNSKSLNATIVK